MKSDKIELEMEDRKVVIYFPEDLDAYEIVEIFRTLMYAMTFSAETIEEVMPEQE